MCVCISEFCFMFVVCSCLETNFRRIFQNNQKISCPLTDTIKMKWSAPSSQMVVLGIASVPCCESKGATFLQMLEWMIISHYILRVKTPHQQEVILNRVHTKPPHTTHLEEHLGMTSCKREYFRHMFSF